MNISLNGQWSLKMVGDGKTYEATVPGDVFSDLMANGVIEEQGTPEEVFGNPQSPKTKAFLQESEKTIDED